MSYRRNEWLPTQHRSSMVESRFTGDDGEVGYVFPGLDACAACHGGAPGAYPGGADDPIKAFGLHPRNLTSESLAALEERGWITGAELVFDSTELAQLHAARDRVGRTPEPEPDPLTAELVGLLRNNCASCHNTQPESPGAPTAFHLDPNEEYTRNELVVALSAKGKMMGERSLPLVEPGDADRSEIMLRLQGLEGRRRMPPIEGGVPDTYIELIDVMREWIEPLPKDER